MVGDFDEGFREEVADAGADRVWGKGAVGFEAEEAVLIDLGGYVFGRHVRGDHHVDRGFGVGGELGRHPGVVPGGVHARHWSAQDQHVEGAARVEFGRPVEVVLIVDLLAQAGRCARQGASVVLRPHVRVHVVNRGGDEIFEFSFPELAVEVLIGESSHGVVLLIGAFDRKWQAT